MSKVCEVCGKGRRVGNTITTRGKAKYLGGVGTKVTGISRRTFLPNLQSVRVTTANGTHQTMRVCAQCLRCGTVVKQVKNAPFKMKSASEAPVPKKNAKKK
ncbi:MAG: 50S ribosomal protein L28 [Planctomycetaceae bacterium]|nr:50S ribosomal protein L28 [Planctomycetaceae bacterium]